MHFRFPPESTHGCKRLIVKQGCKSLQSFYDKQMHQQNIPARAIPGMINAVPSSHARMIGGFDVKLRNISKFNNRFNAFSSFLSFLALFEHFFYIFFSLKLKRRLKRSWNEWLGRGTYMASDRRTLPVLWKSKSSWNKAITQSPVTYYPSSVSVG